MKIYYLLVYYLVIVETRHAHSKVIEIEDGYIKGTLETTLYRRQYYSYRGIPYAKPPVGDLRFRDPEPNGNWSGVFQATEDAPKCIQTDYFASQTPTPEGVEDCLYLNVYTPKMCTASLLPVMVFIHPGGFSSGTGRSDYYGPEYLLDKPIVLVTINYRLGAFGFLSTGDDSAAGNWGLKDQALALKWVNKNIEAFNGDKNRVTLFGDSAGAVSVHLHQFSSLSKGLFHRGISQSGTAIHFWARPNNQLQLMIAQVQAQLVNCATETTEIMVNCLRNVPAEVIADSLRYFKTFLGEPSVIYGVSKEQKTLLNPNPFLEEDPLILIRQKNYYPVPWICGVVQDEGIIGAAYLLRNPDNKQILINNLFDNLSILLALAMSVPSNEILSLYNKIVHYYLQDDIQISSDASMQGLIDAIGDRYFVYGAYQAVLLQAMSTETPVWVYNYNYRSKLSYGDYYAKTSQNTNFTFEVCHTDDLVPLFYSPAIFEDGMAFLDFHMSYYMVTLWTNFANTGIPDLGTIYWSPLMGLYNKASANVNDIKYLYIEGSYRHPSNSIKFEIRDEFFVDRIQFWNEAGLLEYAPELD